MSKTDSFFCRDSLGFVGMVSVLGSPPLWPPLR